MIGVGHHFTYYTLYIRRRDGTVCLVDTTTGKAVHIEEMFPLSEWGQTFIKPHGAIGVCLMEDAGEVQVVDEFPVLASASQESRAS